LRKALQFTCLGWPPARLRTVSEDDPELEKDDCRAVYECAGRAEGLIRNQAIPIAEFLQNDDQGVLVLTP
jgi:hypothetical protein